MVFELAGGYRIELTENRRSDPKIFDFIKSLRIDEEGETPLAEAVAEARRQFPPTGEQPNYTLVISHPLRIEINRLLNLANKPDGAIEIRVTTKHQIHNNAPQTMWLWPGLRLIGAGHNIQKSIFTTAQACDAQKVVLDNILTLTYEQADTSIN